MNIAEILIEKLSKEELGSLCDAYDNGEFEAHVIPVLLEQDSENYPAKYKYKG